MKNVLKYFKRRRPKPSRVVQLRRRYVPRDATAVLVDENNEPLVDIDGLPLLVAP